MTIDRSGPQHDQAKSAYFCGLLENKTDEKAMVKRATG
jgi:hypothetical protein